MFMKILSKMVWVRRHPLNFGSHLVMDSWHRIQTGFALAEICWLYYLES